MAIGGNAGIILARSREIGRNRADQTACLAPPTRGQTERGTGCVADARKNLSDDRHLPALSVLRLGGGRSAGRLGGWPRGTGVRRPKRPAIWAQARRSGLRRRHLFVFSRCQAEAADE